MEAITTEEVLDKLDMFQDSFGTIEKFGWWDLEIISVDVGTQFTSTEVQYKFQTGGIWLTLAAPEHPEIKQNSRSEMENVAYDHTLTYGTSASFGSFY